ncbi:hypothetical protein KOR42_04000 [Thalassoglobus neptunius]|uniref:Sulfatase n=1 Tax=Thalassoglobus neptunius TaxID=1938619 RepID=A0A5C5X4H8_9PLAN|nr:DUF1501 domain-containing protein [Thalassoglobus neptunius]TWT57042.1 hypothetical protein KOR42_04000 [Thalassoglobus neptunius]
MTHATIRSLNTPTNWSRREFLTRSGGGLGALAAASFLATEQQAQASQTIHSPHFAPRAKQVIYLFMHGGPSHVDLFDPKPVLEKYAGQPLPKSFGNVMTRRKVGQNPLLPSVKKFRKHGESGIEVSEFLPHLAGQVDELCVLRGVHGDSVNHPQSVYQMNTGSILMGKPSLGSWVSYGLGTENQNLPGFVVMPDRGTGIKGGPPAWGSGFLPATYQGTTVRTGPTPILHLDRPEGINEHQQRKMLDFINTRNREHLHARGFDGELEARIESYELAFRMQAAAPEAMNFREEPPHIQQLYGIDQPETNEFGTRCLLARRLIERGVRFVQLYSGDTNGWDAHTDVLQNHSHYCQATDLPVAGLLQDLRQRGLLDETLVIWGGEFGRMPMSEQGKGRDHNPWGYTVWMAGGGVKPGMTYGATDDVGLRAVEGTVHIHDLHATILHLLGFDHELLTYFHNGRDERLTDVAGRVVHEILA